jgi:hypothetical protein
VGVVVAEPGKVSVMSADDDVGLEDEQLRQEIHLLGELLAAVAGATEHLHDAQIDDVLGSRPRNLEDHDACPLNRRGQRGRARPS